MKKWILRIVFLLIVLIITGFFFAKSYLTRNYIVAAIEKSINSRIQVEDIDVNLYGLSGTVDLNNVIIAQRDEVADQKIPHDQRDPIQDGDIHLKSVTFNISIWEIISKKILVENIHLDGAKINLTLCKDGAISIEKLFAKPRSTIDKKEKPETFNAKENESFVTTINHINLSNVELNLIVEKTQLVVKGTGVYLNLIDINVNPEKLETINNATIKLGGKLDLHSLDSNQSIDYGDIILAGESEFTLFNTQNGDLEPDMTISLTIDSDSYLTNKVPVISGIWKAADVLKKFGINSLKLPERVAFKNDQSVRVGYKLGITTLLDPISIKVNDWELEVLPQSWLELGNDLHRLGLKLYAGDAISTKLDSLLNKSSTIGGILGKVTSGSGAASWLENGKLTLHLESSGELTSPKVKIKNNLAKPSEELIDSLLGGSDKKEDDPLKKAGKDLLKDLLR